MKKKLEENQVKFWSRTHFISKCQVFKVKAFHFFMNTGQNFLENGYTDKI